LLTVLLARHLTADQYGRFVVLFGALMVSMVVHAALVTYPISVLGPRNGAEQLRQFAANSVLLTLGVDLLMAPCLWICCGALGCVYIFPLACGTMVMSHLQETMRRALMSHLRHGAAVPGDVAMYLGQFVLAFAALRFGHLNLTFAVGSILVAATAGAMTHALRLGAALPDLRAAFRAIGGMWRLGRWPLLTNAGYAVTYQLFPWMLAHQALSASATYQAALNVVAVVNPLAFAAGNLVVPAVAHARIRSGTHSPWQVALRYLWMGIALIAPFVLATAAAPHAMIRLLYGAASPYMAMAGTLRVLAIASLFMYIGHVLSFYFLGMEDTAAVLKTQCAASLAAVCVAVWAIPLLGPFGAAVALTAMNGTRVIGCLICRPRSQSVCKPAVRERQAALLAEENRTNCIEPSARDRQDWPMKCEASEVQEAGL
jgi:O-antigen/teichoic acid export membrane protein